MADLEQEDILDFDNINILKVLEDDKDIIEANEDKFTVKASSLVDAWKKEQTV